MSKEPTIAKSFETPVCSQNHDTLEAGMPAGAKKAITFAWQGMEAVCNLSVILSQLLTPSPQLVGRPIPVQQLWEHDNTLSSANLAWFQLPISTEKGYGF